jgi:hypothetical protein|tara:strand:+ start:3053 stop:3247 length:195 start_codon:yes stop_codon:yes gene_type:complete
MIKQILKNEKLVEILESIDDLLKSAVENNDKRFITLILANIEQLYVSLKNEEVDIMEVLKRTRQ